MNQLHDKEMRNRLESRFLAIHRSLRQGTAARAVEAILPMLGSASAAAVQRAAGEEAPA